MTFFADRSIPVIFSVSGMYFSEKIMNKLITGDYYIDNFNPAYLNPYLMSLTYPYILRLF
jgi:hypothetical protein